MINPSNTERVRLIKQKVLIDTQPPEMLDALICQDAIIESPANFNQLKGARGLCFVIDYWKKAFPDVHSEWSQTEEKENGVVMIHWKAKGHHTGDDFFGTPASGAPVSYSGRTTYQFDGNGQLTHYQVSIDIDAIKAQLG